MAARWWRSWITQVLCRQPFFMVRSISSRVWRNANPRIFVHCVSDSAYRLCDMWFIPHLPLHRSGAGCVLAVGNILLRQDAHRLFRDELPVSIGDWARISGSLQDRGTSILWSLCWRICMDCPIRFFKEAVGPCSSALRKRARLIIMEISRLYKALWYGDPQIPAWRGRGRGGPGWNEASRNHCRQSWPITWQAGCAGQADGAIEEGYLHDTENHSVSWTGRSIQPSVCDTSTAWRLGTLRMLRRVESNGSCRPRAFWKSSILSGRIRTLGARSALLEGSLAESGPWQRCQAWSSAPGAAPFWMICRQIVEDSGVTCTEIRNPFLRQWWYSFEAVPSEVPKRLARVIMWETRCASSRYFCKRPPVDRTCEQHCSERPTRGPVLVQPPHSMPNPKGMPWIALWRRHVRSNEGGRHQRLRAPLVFSGDFINHCRDEWCRDRKRARKALENTKALHTCSQGLNAHSCGLVPVSRKKALG